MASNFDGRQGRLSATGAILVYKIVSRPYQQAVKYGIPEVRNARIFLENVIFVNLGNQGSGTQVRDQEVEGSNPFTPTAAGVVKRYHRCLPSTWHGFDTRHPL